MEDTCTCFQVDGFCSPHVVGDAGCRGCSSAPERCKVPGCSGLVHVEKLGDCTEDGDFSTWTEECCDACGEKDREWVDTRENVVARWNHLDARIKQWKDEIAQSRERERRARFPTAPEIIEDWIQSVRDALQRDGLARPELTIRYAHPYRSTSDVERLFSGSLGDFTSDLQARVRASSGELAPRIAVASLLWNLSSYYPSFAESGSRVNEDTGEFEEYPYWVTDRSTEWHPQQRFFKGILGEVVHQLDVKACSDWGRVRLELALCCAAHDWHLAARLLKHAATKNLKTDAELAAIAAHITYLRIWGEYLDNQFGLAGAKRGAKLLWAAEDLVLSRRMAPEFLEFECDIVDTHAEDIRHPQAIIVAGALCDNTPWMGAVDRDDTAFAARELERYVVNWQHDSRPFYVSVLAQLLEATGQSISAARLYSSFVTDYPDAFGISTSLLYGTKAARLFSEAKEWKSAEGVLNSCLRANPSARRALQALLHVQIELGKTNEAKVTAHQLASVAPTSVELQRLLFGLEEQTLHEEVESRLQAWAPFASMTDEARKDWRFAILLYERHAEKHRVNAVRDAAFRCAKTVEHDLKRKVFDALKNSVRAKEAPLERQLDELRKSDGRVGRHLSEFLQNGRQPSFGDMIAALVSASDAALFQALRSFVRIDFPRLLDSDVVHVLRQLKNIRDIEGHSYELELDVAAKARELAEVAHEALVPAHRAVGGVSAGTQSG